MLFVGLKRVLRNPQVQLAKARKNRQLEPILRNFTDEDVHQLAASYQSGALSDHVNTYFGAAGAAQPDHPLAETIAKIPVQNVDALKNDYATNCPGPCQPPP